MNTAVKNPITYFTVILNIDKFIQESLFFSFRLRQLKIRNDSCFVPIIIQEMRRNISKLNPSECFDHYSSKIEDHINFGPGLMEKDSSKFNADKNKFTDFSA